MTINEWKGKLRPSLVLLVCYFVVPVIVQWFMGSHNAIKGGFSISLLLQSALGIALVYKLFGLEQSFRTELTAWLEKFNQPQDKTRELVEQIMPAAGFIAVIGIAGPPIGEILANSKLMTLAKIASLGYIGYLAYNIWKLSEPFLAYVPVPEPEEPAAPSRRVSAPPSELSMPPDTVKERRCAKCGQLIEDAAAKDCAFCHQAIE